MIILNEIVDSALQVLSMRPRKMGLKAFKYYQRFFHGSFLSQQFMIASFPSSESLRYNPNTNHPYISIRFHDNRYRLRNREFCASVVSIEMWQIFWTATSLCMVALLLYEHQTYSHNWIFLGLASMGSAGMSLHAVKNRGCIGKMLMFTTCSMLCYLVSCLVSCLVGRDQLVVPTLVYIVAELGGSAVLLENRSQIIGKLILLLQLYLIVMKLDHRLDQKWEAILFGFVLLHFLSFFFFLSVVPFLLASICCFKEQLSSIKNIGIIYIAISTTLFFLMSAVVLSGNFLTLSRLGPTIAIVILTSLFNLYSLFFKQQIVLFLCKREKVKENNQIISLVEIPEQQVHRQLFVRKSDNWYSMIPRSQYIRPPLPETAQDLNLGDQQCLICLDQRPNVVWMPCGHLCLCMDCADRVFENKNSSCILCKDSPDSIFLVSEDAIYQQSEKISCSVDPLSTTMPTANPESSVVIEQELTRKKKSNRLAQVLYPTQAYSIKIC